MPIISLKYAGWCRDCNTQLDVGEPAFYAGKERLWCLDCAEEHEEYSEQSSKPASHKPAARPASIDVWALPEAALGLLPDPPQVLAEAAYRVLAKLYHPDTGNGDEEQMKRLNKAIQEVRQRFQ